MKIAIVYAPPACGVWLQDALANLYLLPAIALPSLNTQDPIEIKTIEKMGLAQGDWVTCLNCPPTPEIVAWFTQCEVKIIVPLSHPADILLRDIALQTMPMPLDEYIEQPFADLLTHMSSWRDNGAIMLQTENLWRDPIKTLHTLIKMLGVQIVANDDQQPIYQIRCAIARTDFDCLPLQTRSASAFLHVPYVGGWVKALPQSVISVLLNRAPYPALLEKMGYALNPFANIVKDPQVSPVIPAFEAKTARYFDNGVVFAPMMRNLFLSFDLNKAQSFGDIARTNEGSFYAWLSSAVDLQDPKLTPLMQHIYKLSWTLQQRFPNPLTTDRQSFVAWCKVHFQTDFDIDPIFLN